MTLPPRPPVGELIIDHRARLERDRLEAAMRRERALLDQCSTDNSAQTRVLLWERLHQVRLPKDPAHPILAVVARQTALQISEVLEVMRQRALPKAPQPS